MRTLLCFINICLISGFINLQAQEDTITIAEPIYKEKYGLRIGGDVFKLARSFYDEDYTGFEVNADFRLNKKIYIAGEIGFEEKITTTDFLKSTASGSYLRGGIDYNLYQNWLDMENMIFAGFRIGAATFSQDINGFTIYDVNNLFWNQQFSSGEGEKFSNLTALWTEIIFGTKVQVLPNLYIGFNVQLKFMLSNTQPNNFENLYIPGFNRTYSNSSFGAGFGYNISYLIPIYKRDK
jgi:hypothetical protein